MKKLNCISIMILTILLIAACGPQATETPVFQGENPYAPRPGDEDMQRDQVIIDSSSMSLAKSMPPQILLQFAYFPPTTCHELRVEVSGPDAQNQINVTAYSVVKKDQVCILMALVTPLDASLNLGSFPSGHYSLSLNGAVVGEFDS
ncbi:MAG: hypothetical protein JNM55_20070 [Anaerolineales bacterium]|nr:hypothetical protein [Anaerolineales bacterium]